MSKLQTIIYSFTEIKVLVSIFDSGNNGTQQGKMTFDMIRTPSALWCTEKRVLVSSADRECEVKQARVV